MAFLSQLKESKLSSRRGSNASIFINQSFKKSNQSEELSIRLSSQTISNLGMSIGERVDVLYDPEGDLWMIRSAGSDGFAISGKEGAPTGLVRYTLKANHARLTKERAELPVKRECDESSLIFDGKSVIFSLVNDEDNK